MKRFLKYLSYLLRHKWYVFIECCKEGIPIRGFFHDMSKFRPKEFIPYMNFFYGKPKARDKAGYYKPTDTGDKAFDFAWLLHQKKNQHHWQWWVLPEDDGGVKILPMSDKARLEMICDWKGAGKAQGHTGKDECRKWYVANRHKMQIDYETTKFIQKKLGCLGIDCGNA
jgi:hypothetical protein